MKHKKLIFFALTGLVFATSVSYSQTDVLKEANEYLSVFSGSQNLDKKVLKEPAPQALVYIALKFRSASTGTTQTGFGKNVVRSAAYALLDGVDSVMCQTITDEFYKILLDKLKTAGVSTIPMEKIKASKKYQAFVAEKPALRNFNHKETGTSTVYSENHNDVFDIGAAGMKLYKMQQEFEAGMAYLRLTIDFVEFDMSIKDSYYSVNATANVRPVIKITSLWSEAAFEGGSTGGLSMTNGKYTATTLFSNVKPIYSPYEAEIKIYDEKVPEYAQKKRFFGGGGMQLGTFVVKPNQEAFHKAAIEGLTRYADYVAAIIKSYNEKK